MNEDGLCCVRGCGTRRVVFSWSSAKIVASVALLLALQRLRRLRQHLKHLREQRSLEVQLRGVAAHRLQRLVQRLVAKVLVPQRVALVPGVRDGVLGQVMFRDVDLDKGTSSPCAACAGRTRPASDGKQQKRTRRTRVTDTKSCERFVCRHTQNSLHALVLRICDSAYLHFCALPRVPEVRRLALLSRWISARP